MRCSDALRVMRVRMEAKYQHEHSSAAVLLCPTNLVDICAHALNRLGVFPSGSNMRLWLDKAHILVHIFGDPRIQAVLISWDLFSFQWGTSSSIGAPADVLCLVLVDDLRRSAAGPDSTW